MSAGRGISTDDKLVAKLRLGNQYGAAGWPIELEVDEAGATEVITAMANLLATSFDRPANDEAGRRQQRQKAAIFLHKIADNMDSVG